jgi:L-lactate dehydrogenase complex protein LldG
MKTNKNARERILANLKSARKKQAQPRPPMPPLSELRWNTERMIKEFTDNLQAQTAPVHRVKDYAEASEKFAEILAAEGVKKIAISTDAVLQRLNLGEWGRKHQVEILRAEDSPNKDDFKRLIFDEAQAGVTGADFAIAESGTLCLIHDKNQPRLVSLAPITHIAIVPLERLFPVYEDAIDAIFGRKENLPSQVTFITGPSMTADIQGIQFKGMHGPKKLFAILVG